MLKILGRIDLEETEVYATVGNNRTLIARCNAELEVCEESTSINVLGSQGCKVKKRKFSVVLCGDMLYTRAMTMEFLNKIKAFGLKFCVQRSDGVFETFNIFNLSPDDIDIDGEWKFTVLDMPDRLKKIIDCF